jgi:hypothetical protein
MLPPSSPAATPAAMFLERVAVLGDTRPISPKSVAHFVA